MSSQLTSRRIAMLVHHGFEEVELTSPRDALKQAGAQVDIVSPVGESVKSWRHDKWGESFKVDKPLSEASVDDYDALVLPGGVMNPDHLRRDPEVLSFVRLFFESGKPVGAICHGPWTLIDAGVVDGRQMTSYHTLQTDLKNARAIWKDEQVVVDDGLITSRSPDDLDAFNEKLIEVFSQTAKSHRHAA